jgi:CheY-like chemotaxis protein
VPNRIGEPRRVGGSDKRPIWLIGLSDEPDPGWRLQFLRAAHTSGFFDEARISVGASAIVFGIEPSALSLACDKIDDWIAEANAATSSSTRERPATPSVSAATIMVVDDQGEIGRMARDVLEPAGYSVILTSDPYEAVRLAKDHSRTIDLLLTDVVMPLMDGRELARRILAIRPVMKVVLMSAYDVSGVSATGWPFIAKPFGIEGLRQKIAKTLRERSRESGPAQ